LTTKREILFTIWSKFFQICKGDGQYTSEIRQLATLATRLRLLSEYQHLAKSII